MIDLADPAHRLRIGAHHADGAPIVQNVLGRDRLRPNPTLREGDVFRHLRDR